MARLASALDTELVAAEARRAEQAPTPDSMDLNFRGCDAQTPGRLLRAPQNRRSAHLASVSGSGRLVAEAVLFELPTNGGHVR